MKLDEFIEYWTTKLDHDGSPAIGIEIRWSKIQSDALVKQYTGHEAWSTIGNFYTPLWGDFERTILREWLNPNHPDYDKFIAEERKAGKIDLYAKNGLLYPDFCAFADKSGLKGVLADGSHRFIDINYLIITGKDFEKEIIKCRLDVIYLSNLKDVLAPIDSQVIDN